MQKILRGVHRFQEEVYPPLAGHYRTIAESQQKPRALFITCSDSRILPNVITQCDPGDLFLIRNAGNIIPPYGALSGGETATIEYAVSVLGVSHVILCGHTHCEIGRAHV